jgi:hypothetical protein
MKSQLTVAVMMLMICLQACSDTNSWPNDQFDSAKWHNTKQDQRYRMVNSLITRKLLIGLTSSEVEQVLGPPDSWGQAHEYCTYVVKVGGTGFNQVFILDLGFDAVSAKVISARVRGD